MDIKVKMPGVIISYEVEVGAQVQAGQVVAFIEAMKTKFSIVAPASGQVAEILVAPHCRISAGTVIMRLQESISGWLQDYVFATIEDYQSYRAAVVVGSEFKVEDNRLYQAEQYIAQLVPLSHIREMIVQINKMSLEPERKMPSCGWRFELFKNKQGFLEYEFTKREWLRKGREYVGVSFEVCSAFEREDAAPLISYFQAGGLLESIAVDVYFRYDRLFAKFRPAAYSIEQVPDLQDFMQTYMPMVYGDLLETVTYGLIEEFDPQPYVDRVVREHYSY
mgnify:CR=1 FL=1